ncbi:MAG: hypothetical protein HOH66_17485 [Rhodospirillaceae bacterium]|nr:hypothetical protein [Rhodospirillaceae bacterium]
MDDITLDVRKFVYDTIVETAHPPIAQHVADRFGLPRAEVVRLFHVLQDERQLTLIPGTDRIFMAHPFSALITPYRVRLRRGPEYFINCAFDTLAAHPMLGDASMTISGFCHRTGKQIEILLDGGRIEWLQPATTVVYLGIPARRWWENIIDTCGNQFLFFATEADAEAWEKETDRVGVGRSISVETCLRLVDPVYRDKLKSDYVRPTAEMLNRHLRSLGLVGGFWEY